MSNKFHAKTGVIKGVDTIAGLAGNPPNVIPIPLEIIKKGTSLLTKWNSYHLAFIPYCFVCKEPLDWAQGDKEVVFICPKCDRRWVLDEENAK